MPIFFQQEIDDSTRLGIWKIEESETFFLAKAEPQREVTHPHKKLQHLAGRYLLKHLFPNFPVELIKVADTRKPFLENEAYHFSISHCGDYAAAIVSKTARVGVDIELPTPKVVRISHKFLHAEELEQWRQTKDIQLATVLWSVKEAMFKWWGRGNVDFSEMLRIEDVHLNKDQVFQARFIKGEIAVSFPVHYKLFDEIVLAWVKTDAHVINTD